MCARGETRMRLASAYECRLLVRDETGRAFEREGARALAHRVDRRRPAVPAGVERAPPGRVVTAGSGTPRPLSPVAAILGSCDAGCYEFVDENNICS